MIKRDYRQMLLNRIEQTFSEWEKRERITEKELYRFLHTLKGTSGTIGMRALSAFCASQLTILSPDNASSIPVQSLSNFRNKIRNFLEGIEELAPLYYPDIYKNCFNEQTSVLIIDDDLEFVSYVKELLEQMGAQVIIALNGKRGMEQFYSVRPNFILIDIYLPDMTGFEVLDKIANTARARHVTVAITSVDDCKENKITAFERGAMDFIPKPLETETFVAYLLNRDEMRRTIDKSVVTDGLTGVGNRRYFDEMITSLANGSDRTGLDLTLVMIDLDHFKKINDIYGHPAGDEVLRKLGEVVMREKRDTDYIFRYGGEEFAVLLNNTTAEQSIHIIDRIREKINALVFIEKDTQFSVTFSAGIASYKGEVAKLIASADNALYEAKRCGRNKTIVYSTEANMLKRKLHLIIVDDDNLIRTMLYKKLSDWHLPDIDIHVHEFADGPSFLDSDWYRTEEYYIVLLDGIMPKMDGLEVLGRIKRETDEKNVMVSMMTARTGDSDIKAALWLGADDYIMKPFRPSDVLSRIQQLTMRIFSK